MSPVLPSRGSFLLMCCSVNGLNRVQMCVYRDHPVFLMFMQLAVISIFKSYPTVGDVALYLAFIPVWSHLHRCEWGGGISDDVVYVGFF